MKKLVFVIALVAGVATATQAQYRPAGGEKSLEVNFAPLGGNPVSISGIKLRSFSSQESAFRLGLFIGVSNSKTITQDEDTNDDGEQIALELADTDRSFSIAIQPGIERHLTGTDRLSPYLGGFVNIGYTSTTSITENQIELGDVGDPNLSVGSSTSRGGTLNLGLNAVAGFDYYVAEHLYLGSEIGFGFAFNRDLVNKVEDVYAELNDAGDRYVERTEENESTVGNKSSWQIGPNVIAQLRLGWLF